MEPTLKEGPNGVPPEQPDLEPTFNSILYNHLYIKHDSNYVFYSNITSFSNKAKSYLLNLPSQVKIACICETNKHDDLTLEKYVIKGIGHVQLIRLKRIPQDKLMVAN